MEIMEGEGGRIYLFSLSVIFLIISKDSTLAEKLKSQRYGRLILTEDHFFTSITTYGYFYRSKDTLYGQRKSLKYLSYWLPSGK